MLLIGSVDFRREKGWRVVCVYVCVTVQGPIMGLCLRAHLKAQQFRRMKFPNHELYYVTHNGWYNHHKEVKMRGNQLVWIPPPTLSPSEFDSPLSQKGTHKLKGTLCWWWSFTVTCCCHGFGNHTAVPPCLCAGKETAAGKEKPKMAGWASWMRIESEYRGTKLQEWWEMYVML